MIINLKDDKVYVGLALHELAEDSFKDELCRKLDNVAERSEYMMIRSTVRKALRDYDADGDMEKVERKLFGIYARLAL